MTCLAQWGDEATPPKPSWGDADHQQVRPLYVDIQGSADRQVEGFVDVAHFAFVHHEAFAAPDISTPKYLCISWAVKSGWTMRSSS